MPDRKPSDTVPSREGQSGTTKNPTPLPPTAPPRHAGNPDVVREQGKDDLVK